MFNPEKFFTLEGMWRRLFRGAQVYEALDYLPDFTMIQVEAAGANAAALRKNGDLQLQTCVLHEGRVYYDGFTLLGGDPTKGNMKVILEGREVNEATVVEAGVILKSDDIHLAPGVLLEAGALIKGPTFIGRHSEVRQGAYLRGNCLIGQACVVGHTTEVKNSAMLDEAKAGHFAYLGDSILGRRVNLGAGTKLANLKFSHQPYVFKAGEQTFRVTREKMGAIMGDGAQTGCNSVTSPGVILGRECLVYPCCHVPGGYYQAQSRLRQG
jgi:acyl-[acyl carrier protein]--UDP-N-acetylglucosamine O-acyltransferase